MQASSSIGRATVSKTVGWGFETLLACHKLQRKRTAYTATMNDRIKFALGAILALAGLVGYYFLAEYALIVRVLALLVGFAAGVAVSWFTVPAQELRVFAREAWNEAKRVVWPSRKETWQTTGVVFALVIVMGIFLWFVDLGIGMVVARLLGRPE